MANKPFYILHFGDGDPAWAFFDGSSLMTVEPPSDRSRHVVLALIPDKYFFFFQPKKAQARAGSKARAAALMQMLYQFPRTSEKQDQGVLQGRNGSLLGYFSSSGFTDFWEENQAVLDRANVVSTSFALAWQAAQSLGRESFIWETPEGLKAVKAGEQLFYFKGKDEELKARLKALEEGDEPLPLALDEALSTLAEGKVKFSWLRLSLDRTEGVESVSAGLWGRAFLAVAIVSLFFLAGEIGRYLKLQKEVNAWSSLTNDTYAQVLGANIGNDPYGRILSHLDQLKGTKTQGIPLLGLLEILSRASPQGFNIENLNLTGLSGSIRARIGSFNQLETMLATLQQEKNFAFTLDQAVNTTRDILITLRVEFTSLR